MFQGGSLISDKTFKKILSIGYEFETHDLAKLSLHSNKKTLINSQVSLRVLEDKLKTQSIKRVDENYISVRIPIHADDKPPKEKLAENEAKPMERNGEDEILDEEELEFMEAFGDEYEEEMQQEKRKKMDEHENESYLEYLEENRKKDNLKTIKFYVTNDIGDGDFADVVKNYCEDVEIAKNDMYFFRTTSDKMYDIKFSEEITDSCPTFTGVEYVITYYSPKKENANIIVDTFIDACSRIVDHLGNLKRINGSLLIHDTKKTHYTPIGELGDERCLYHKPDTNLFYLDTYDSVNLTKPQNLGDVVFVPQMTFRCNASDMIDIMKEIMELPTVKKEDSIIRSHEVDLKDLFLLEDLVDKLVDNFNKTAKLGKDRKRKLISKDDALYKTMKTYLFFIYYKLYYYIQNHKVILDKDKEDYLKDYLSFASRHNNTSLYKRIKEILNERFGINEIEEVQRLLCQPSISSLIYKINTPSKFDNNYEGSAKLDLPKTSPHYGDPLHSLPSYFKHFEDPKTDDSYPDWLMEAKIDSYSSTFNLVSDQMLVENRFFRFEIGLWLREMVDPKISKEYLKLKEMILIVNRLYGANIKKMMNLERNPLKNKLTRKCKPGYYRSMNFECLRQKPRKSVKKSKKTATKSKITATKSKITATKSKISATKSKQASTSKKSQTKSKNESM